MQVNFKRSKVDHVYFEFLINWFIFFKDGQTFEFPEIFGEEQKTNAKKDEEAYEDVMKQRREDEKKNWAKRDIPPWFR